MPWTRDQIREGLQKSDLWVNRGILAIYAHQTSEEQQVEDTRFRNNVGFNAADAKRLSYYAKWIQKHGSLSGKHKEVARKKILKYSGQLTKIANGEI